MKQKAVMWTMWVLIAVVSILVTGCGAPGLTSRGVHRRHVETFRNDIWQLQDDIDAALMIDRPSRLSPMMVR
jgi:hypothetical protein